jgi:hypothetical protein
MQQLGLHINLKGIIVCRGRMANAAIPDNAKFPKLLPKNGLFTQLVLQHFHARSGHSGVSQTLAASRSEYWIPAVRSKVSQLVYQCVICRRWQGKPYKQPLMPEQLECRVTPHAAFTHTGVDYFGPLNVRNEGKVSHVWICLFTCLTVRAIHLEVVADLTTVEFIAALRRFVARRGRPMRFISDNAPHFKLASDVVSRIWSNIVDNPEVYSYCTNEGIRWTFITQYAPWAGGVYERLVGIVKAPLRKSLGRALLSTSELATLLCEIEAIVNSRPLTFVGDDLNDKEVLTPNHFLMLNPKCGTPTCEDESDDPDFELLNTTESDIVNLWKKGQNILNEFWKQWTSEYLLGLRQRQSYHHKRQRSTTVEPRVGHVVLIKDPCLPRGSWRLARVYSLIPSHDGEVRTALVKLSRTGRIVRRPLSLLCPFEFTEASDLPCRETEESDTESAEEVREVRPKRSAAVRAREIIRANNEWMLEPID